MTHPNGKKWLIQRMNNIDDPHTNNRHQFLNFSRKAFVVHNNLFQEKDPFDLLFQSATRFYKQHWASKILTTIPFLCHKFATASLKKKKKKVLSNRLLWFSGRTTISWHKDRIQFLLRIHGINSQRIGLRPWGVNQNM